MALKLAEFCRKEIMRLAHYPGFPTEDLAVRDLVDALAESGKSPDNAKRIIDEIVASLPAGLRCPTAADILRLGAKLAPPTRQPDQKCPRCHGLGYIMSDCLCTEEPTPDGVRKTRERITEEQAYTLGRQIGAQKASRQMVYSAAERCGCAG